MTTVAKLLDGRPELQKRFAVRAADPAVSGDGLLIEMRAAGLPVKRTAVYLWRRQHRSAARHRPNTLAGRVASALRTATPDQLATLRLSGVGTTAAVFKLGRKRLYAVARSLGLYPLAPPEADQNDVNDG